MGANKGLPDHCSVVADRSIDLGVLMDDVLELIGHVHDDYRFDVLDYHVDFVVLVLVMAVHR